MDNVTTIKALLDYLVASGGARLSIWVMNKVKQPEWDVDTCTYLGLGLAGAFSVVGYLLGVVMLYNPQPTAEWREWVNLLGGVFLVGAIGAKVWYDKLPLGGHQ